MRARRFQLTAPVAAIAIVWAAAQTGAQKPSILAPAQTIRLPQALIWGGISFDGEYLGVTTTFVLDGRPQLFLRKLDLQLHQAGPLVQLTFESDPESARHITDHKQLFARGSYYVVFSTAGDSDLYILRTDRDGRRLGAIVPVVKGTSDRTNDMMLATDGDLLHIGYFRPPQRSVIHTLDMDLRQVRPPLVTSAELPHNNLGGMVYHEGRFYLFTGDKAGPNSNLIVTVWNRDWTPAQPSPRILIPAPAGGGYFFATGIAFDKPARRWYLGFHHVENSDPDATTHIDLAGFDESFNLLEHQHGPAGYRPHFLLVDLTLYMVYDRDGVFLSRYQVRVPAEIPTAPAPLHHPSVVCNDNRCARLALVNSGYTVARLTAAIRDLRDGAPGRSAELALPAGSMIDRPLSEWFGEGLRTDGGWLRISGDLYGIHAALQSFGASLESLDGAAAVDRPLFYLLFPILENAEIALVNPGTQGEAVVALRRFHDDGSAIEESRVFSIAPQAGRVLTSADLSPVSGGYLAVHSTAALVAAARMSDPDGRWEGTLNALDANAGSRTLVSPQYVFDNDYRTVVTVVNLDDAPTDLVFRLAGSEGETVGEEWTMPLQARGRMVLDDPAPFGIAPGSTLNCSLWISSSATRLAGTVLFADRDGRRFRSVLPLQADMFDEMLYPQAAMDATCFTGLAAVNAGARQAEVRLKMFAPDGTPVAGGSLSIPPRGRISRLLWELAPMLLPMSRGYFTVLSSEPLYGFSAVGTHRLSALATFAPQSAPRAEYNGAAPAGSYLKVNPDSDFAPPRGGVAGGPGPAMVRLMAARSPDGLHFTRTNEIVTDQGAVPDLVVDGKGVIYLYYTGWVVGNEINKTVVAISRDGGESWTFRRLDLRRNPGESDLVDPDVLILDDGTFRLYTTIGANNQYPRTHYSDSTDGIRFERKGVAFDPGAQALDPSAIRIGSRYHIFAGGAASPEINWHGISDDAAVYRYDRQMIFPFDGYGQMMANGLAVDGGYRFYSFGNNRVGGIASFFTTDGETWTADPALRLGIDESTGLEEGMPTDPAIARLADGSYLMVYSVRIPARR